ncbi:M23 family metallopeptidase [Oerskovia paurometabola]|uniref:Peptidoglycan DD-metalloendopeptidase family protein n=1 Tax=Oerskovia paurometabola TaxID=162170 RepID=A0ABW1X7I4_9CELL|nr:M23 family metallopeptidase [Oerskovia paurometabola]MBM7497991.1 murein DD-endopeptidase MepM/ murein hydrolase activator NlpD [Oerskovia paurometabola]
MSQLTRRLAAGGTALLLLLGTAVAATADDLDDKRAAAERRQSQALKDREGLESQLEGTDAELAQAILDLQTIEGRLPVAQAELDTATAELERTQREAAQLEVRLQDAQAEEQAINLDIQESAGKASSAKRSIAEMARQAYRGQGEVSGLGIVTGAQSTEDFIEQYAMSSTAARTQARALTDLQEAESIARNREARLTAIRETIADLKVQADQNVVAADAARTAAADRKAEIEELIAEQQAKQATIESRKEAALAQMAANEQAQAALTSELQGIIAAQTERDRKAAEEAAKQPPPATGGGSGGGGGSTGGGGGGGGGGAVTSGFLAYPTAVPHITSSYGMRKHPFLPVTRLHAGMDLRAYCGTPIYAAAGGTVQFARTYGGLGNQVVVNHGTVGGKNLMTSYNHLTRYVVSAGQSVSQGTLVGYSGTTGTSQVCHLHFEVYENGSTVDPAKWLR